MSGQEIIELGVQAGLCDEFGDINFEYGYHDEIIAFAKLVATKEREACAKVCDDLYRVWAFNKGEYDSDMPDALDCRRAIRART